MILTRMIAMAAVVLFFGAMLPVHAQRGRDDDRRDDQKSQKGKSSSSQGKQSRNTERQPQTRQSPQQQRPQQQRPQERSEQQARSWQQQRGWAQKGGWQSHDTWQQHRAQNWSNDHRSWAQRGGYGGYYIPQNRFVLSFGNQHYFRLHSRPVMYQGYPRFDYGGYKFLMVDPYPEYWAYNWYDADDVFIDYDDGYYLHNRRYPQVRLAVTIAF